MPQEIRRVGLYARVSTTDQNLEWQIEAIRKECAYLEWPIVAEYTESRSGKLGAHRPQWEQLRKDARARKFDCVAVWAIDRMGRSVLAISDAVQEFIALKIKLLVVKDNFDVEDPSGRFMATILAGMAELERDMNSQRTKVGLDGARARGVRLGRAWSKIPAAGIRQVIAGERTAADLARELGLAATTVRNRVRTAKKDPASIGGPRVSARAENTPQQERLD